MKPTLPSKDYALLFDHLKNCREAVCISYEKDPDKKNILIERVEIWTENSLDPDEDTFKERCRILDVEFMLISRFSEEEMSPMDLPEKVVEEIMLLQTKANQYASGEKNFPWSVVRDQLNVTCEAISAYRREKEREDDGPSLSTDYDLLWKKLNRGHEALGFIQNYFGWTQQVVCKREQRYGEFFTISEETTFKDYDEMIKECNRLKFRFITFKP